MLVAYREDDPEHITVDLSDEEWVVDILVFLNEHGGDVPEALLTHMRSWPWANEMVRQYVAIAEALAARDATRLTTAIQEAETHDLVTHAARMRIILAQQTHDRAPLERARPVLQRLGDRRSLRRLEEVMVAVSQARKKRSSGEVNTE